MTKRTFLKKLREKLNILDENEINDIINEYETIIDDKVNNGETEKEAILEFGDINELSKEILKAYKINPKFNKNDDEDDENFNSIIKKCANKLSNFTKSVVDEIKDNNINIETVFEIIIKSLVLLLILAILRIPFELIESLGKYILDVMIFPVNKILIVVWNFFLWILYILSCILIGIALFKDNIKTYKNNIKIDKESIKIEKKTKEKIKESNNDKLEIGSALKMIFKVFVTIIFLIPIWCVVIALSIVLAIAIYYTVTGINLLGIALIIIGLIVFALFMASIFNKIFTGKKIRFLSSTIVGIVFIVIGIFLTIDTFKTYQYIDGITEKDFIKSTSYEVIKINDNTYIENCKKYIDDDILDNEIKIEYSYYSDIFDINMYKRNSKVYFEYKTKENGFPLKIYNNIIDSLKQKKIYNYSKLDEINVNIYANKNTIDKVFCTNTIF